MATAKLSTIVTAVAGSIGGLTFRRSRNTTVIQTKSIGNSRSGNLTNTRLLNLRTLVTDWTSLSTTVKNQWFAAALLFQFPDKFGTLHYLTGRQLYLKLQGNLIVTNGSTLDPTTLVSAINATTLSSFIFTINSSNVISAIVNTSGYASNTTALVQAEIINNESKNSTFTRREVITYFNLTASTSLNITTALTNKYPFLKIGDIVRIYITLSNNYGFRSTPLSIVSTLTLI